MQAMATITETQSASYRTLRLVPRWPDAESCCGVLLCVFDNKDNCWEATSGVRSVYNNSLRSAIDEILDDNEDHLGQDARYRPFFCHSIYMVGRKKKRSNPVIFFCCEDAPLRVKARDVIKANSVTRSYPAIRLGHTSFPPELNAPPRFVTGRLSHPRLGSAGLSISPDILDAIPSPPKISPDTLDAIPSPLKNLGGIMSLRRIDKTKVSLRQSNILLDLPSLPRITEHRIVEEGSGSGRQVFYKPGKQNLCAVKVYVDDVIQYERDITATVGGAILLNGKIYGLTAAHGLLEGFQRSEAQRNMVRSVEYDGDSASSFEHCECFPVVTNVMPLCIHFKEADNNQRAKTPRMRTN
ncbi:uncharacterized protein K444DRAFT_691203 [Hyaloscypha bicolor E]|uniref:Uncharacterized protein n=1 Tax=Hyaloscypha bicolor E TaxID=1095630 RepID=A0A2J6T461_9HELO|nr:uncharacterized protein K444DRAFT_691203 [Hyaloscypha bicolor E]PMD57814.1 hypothetical protein K444DRAFT_691203 [Hyaloscypha bicolor E]